MAQVPWLPSTFPSPPSVPPCLPSGEVLLLPLLQPRRSQISGSRQKARGQFGVCAACDSQQRRRQKSSLGRSPEAVDLSHPPPPRSLLKPTRGRDLSCFSRTRLEGKRPEVGAESCKWSPAKGLGESRLPGCCFGGGGGAAVRAGLVAAEQSFVGKIKPPARSRLLGRQMPVSSAQDLFAGLSFRPFPPSPATALEIESPPSSAPAPRAA